ncbi:MAG TPA: hybrid sensor histidine kinase/response regulator [Verrucomicrobiae bacterium]|jgi:two-component system sensor histidine kinase/response regulator
MNATKPAAAPVEQNHAAPVSAQFNELEPARILVVDDQPANIQIVGAVLGNLGHEIVPAPDGMTALKRIALRMPDLILLDLLMPGMDGCEVCRRLKKNPDWKDIPVIFLSASDDKDLIVRALDSGGVDYITKPFNHAELISRVRTQLALKSARDQLKQLAEDKDELLGILAHDLKNYLGGINMSAELMSGQIKRFNDERLTQLSENMLRSSALAMAFVKEFLANSATDHGFTLKPSAVNLADAAASTVRQHQEAARRKKIKIESGFPDEPAIVFADASALDQILDNLISNALKFSPPDKNIFVSVHRNGSRAECAVRDEGPGFTAEDKARMFRRYARLSARPTGGEPSTGLGLSIVRKLVQAMGGELACESNPGQGATFTIRLSCSISA